MCKMKVQGIESNPILLPQESGTAPGPGRDDASRAVTPGQTVDRGQNSEDPGPDQEKRTAGKALAKAVDTANKTLEAYSTELRFVIHRESGEIMVKVIDTRDNKVIREIPPETVLNFVAYVKKLLGIIIDRFI